MAVPNPPVISLRYVFLNDIAGSGHATGRPFAVERNLRGPAPLAHLAGGLIVRFPNSVNAVQRTGRLGPGIFKFPVLSFLLCFILRCDGTNI